MNIKSTSLVVAQMILIWLLITPVNAFIPQGVTNVSGLALLVVGILIGLWAVWSLTRKNLSVMPEPVQMGTLIQRGPYRYIRHPMYTALIICGIGACIAHGSILKVIYWIFLIVVLYFKLKREEALLRDAYTDYAGYMDRTSALFPRVY